MASTQQRIGDFAASLVLAVILLFVGFFFVVLGDGPSGWALYHAGGMLICSIVFLGLTFLIGLCFPASRLWTPPRFQVLYLSWMGLGSIILGFYEDRNPGRCCSDATVSSNIAGFSLLWPIMVVIPMVVITSIHTSRLRKQGTEPELPC